MTDIQERLDELKELGLYRRMRMVTGPQGPRVVLDGKPVLLLCSNNYLGLADHPRVREAAADAAMRWGVGAGASRLISGTMTIHRRLEERLADFEGPRGVPALRLGLPGQHGRRRGAGARGRGRLLRRAQPRLDRRRLPAGARRDLRLRPRRRRAPRVGPRAGRRPRRADRHRRRVLDGRRRGAARGDRRARPALRRARRRRRGPRHRRAGARRARRGGRGRPRGRGRRRSSARWARRWAPTAPTRAATRRWRSTSSTRARHADLLHGAAPARGGRARWPRSSCSRSSRGGCASSRPTAEVLRAELEAEGFDVGASETQIVPLIVGDAAQAMRDLRGGDRARRLRPGDPPADGAGGHLAPAPRR